jgi:hypothetical protein
LIRLRTASLAALLLGSTIVSTTFAQSAVVPEFDPSPYVGKGNIYNCADFPSQAHAQAVLRADPYDVNDLDRDRDGIACENNPQPYDLERVPRP